MANIASAPSAATAAVAVNPANAWIKDPLNPAANAIVFWELDQPDADRIEDQAEFTPIGRINAVVIGDVIHTDRLRLRFICHNDAEWNALNALRASQRVLLLQTDGVEQWYVRLGPSLQRVTIRRAGSPNNPIRHITTTAVVVDAP